ncbi:histone-lysine N-methyltransferase NSD3 [Striga asiatica]|uniref:Histone-lysine N-methyltransferase NSD3 n=1 Tax=Striga asiatica TaxID=4170 RepID=A0A5A7QD00_STRAF|nr:histone-lysine N-methyltransferase NSD3 [Striga asiatica]
MKYVKGHCDFYTRFASQCTDQVILLCRLRFLQNRGHPSLSKKRPRGIKICWRTVGLQGDLWMETWRHSGQLNVLLIYYLCEACKKIKINKVYTWNLAYF